MPTYFIDGEGESQEENEGLGCFQGLSGVRAASRGRQDCLVRSPLLCKRGANELPDKQGNLLPTPAPRQEWVPLKSLLP